MLRGLLGFVIIPFYFLLGFLCSCFCLLIIFKEIETDLLGKNDILSIKDDLVNYQPETTRIRHKEHLTSSELASLRSLERLLSRSGETFIWSFRASGQTVGFPEAVMEFFSSGSPPRNQDYEFWIRTGIRWLFEKRKSAKDWPD